MLRRFVGEVLYMARLYKQKIKDENLYVLRILFTFCIEYINNFEVCLGLFGIVRRRQEPTPNKGINFDELFYMRF